MSAEHKPHMTPQERADAIRERVSHIARGCRAHTSHQPDVYLNDIDMYLRGFVEQLEAHSNLLRRLREWDMLNSYIGGDGERHEPTADAPYWRDQIDGVLASSPASEPEGR